MVAAVLIGCFALGSEAAEGDKWGAIAYAFDTNGDGYSTNYDTLDGAKERALEECRKYGSVCRVVVWFRNKCAALAVGYRSPDPPPGKAPDGQGFGINESQDVADKEALASCRKTTDNCYIVRSVCAPQ